MPSIVQLLRGPSCPLTVGSAEVKRERKSEPRELRVKIQEEGEEEKKEKEEGKEERKITRGSLS